MALPEITLAVVKELVDLNSGVRVTFTGRLFYSLEKPEFELDDDLHVLRTRLKPIDRLASYPASKDGIEWHAQWVKQQRLNDPVVLREEGPALLVVEHPLTHQLLRVTVHARAVGERFELYGTPNFPADAPA
jgi:hypothetical protein